MKARLIKQKEQKEINNQQSQKASANSSTARLKNVTGVVREWVGQHQKVKTSARQAFAALFAEPEMGRID